MIHIDQGHSPIGTTLQEISQKYWYPELILASYEVIRTCSSCQLMKPPDPSLGNLQLIQPPPPLTRWGINHTQIGKKIILNTIEYATGWLESRLVLSTEFNNTIPLLIHVIHVFGTPKQLISDNALCFTGTEAQNFQTKYNLKFTHTTPARPLTNRKVEQANGVLK